MESCRPSSSMRAKVSVVLEDARREDLVGLLEAQRAGQLTGYISKRLLMSAAVAKKKNDDGEEGGCGWCDDDDVAVSLLEAESMTCDGERVAPTENVASSERRATRRRLSAERVARFEEDQRGSCCCCSSSSVSPHACGGDDDDDATLLLARGGETKTSSTKKVDPALLSMWEVRTTTTTASFEGSSSPERRQRTARSTSFPPATIEIDPAFASPPSSGNRGRALAAYLLVVATATGDDEESSSAKDRSPTGEDTQERPSAGSGVDAASPAEPMPSPQPAVPAITTPPPPTAATTTSAEIEQIVSSHDADYWSAMASEMNKKSAKSLVHTQPKGEGASYDWDQLRLEILQREHIETRRKQRLEREQRVRLYLSAIAEGDESYESDDVQEAAVKEEERKNNDASSLRGAVECREPTTGDTCAAEDDSVPADPAPAPIQAEVETKKTVPQKGSVAARRAMFANPSLQNIPARFRKAAGGTQTFRSKSKHVRMHNNSLQKIRKPSVAATALAEEQVPGEDSVEEQEQEQEQEDEHSKQVLKTKGCTEEAFALQKMSDIEQSLVQWFVSAVGGETEHICAHRSSFGELLRDGVLLCDLVNALSPGAVLRIHRGQTLSNAPYKQMENIANFCQAAICLGVPGSSCFDALDLHLQKNLQRVVRTLETLRSIFVGSAPNFDVESLRRRGSTPTSCAKRESERTTLEKNLKLRSHRPLVATEAAQTAAKPPAVPMAFGRRKTLW